MNRLAYAASTPHAGPWACHPSVDLDKLWYAFTAMLDKATAG